MPTGKIKKIVLEKGYGFIQPDSGRDVFFHHSTVADGQFENLTEGQSVEFTVDESSSRDKGPRAATVKPL